MKKSFTILILSLFIYNTFGFLAVYPFLSIYYKNLGMKETEKHLDHEMIELLILNKEDLEKNKVDFRWIHRREFKYQGEMFDLVKKEEKNNQLFLYCIHDKNEKRLEDEFAKRVNDNSKNSKRQQGANHLNILLSEPAQTDIVSFARVCEFRFMNFCPDDYSSIQLDIPSPPPESLSLS
jgi:hypothetical protein